MKPQALVDLPQDFVAPQWLFERVMLALKSATHLHLWGQSGSGKSSALRWLAWALRNEHVVLEVDKSDCSDDLTALYYSARDAGWIEDAALSSERCLDQGGTLGQAIRAFLHTFMTLNGLKRLLLLVDDLEAPDSIRKSLDGLDVVLISAGSAPVEGNVELVGPDHEALLEQFVASQGFSIDEVHAICRESKGDFNAAFVYCKALSMELTTSIPQRQDLAAVVLEGLEKKCGPRFSQKPRALLELIAEHSLGVVVPVEEAELFEDLFPLLSDEMLARFRLPELAEAIGPTRSDNPLLEACRESYFQNPSLLENDKTSEHFLRICFWLDTEPVQQMLKDLKEPRDLCFNFALVLESRHRYSESIRYLEKALEATHFNSKIWDIFDIHTKATELYLRLDRREKAESHFLKSCRLGEGNESRQQQLEMLKLEWLYHTEKDRWRPACRKLVDQCLKGENKEDIAQALQELMAAQALDGDYDLAISSAKQAQDYLEDQEELEEFIPRRMVFLDRNGQWSKILELNQELEPSHEPLFFAFLKYVYQNAPFGRNLIWDSLNSAQHEEELDWFTMEYLLREGRLWECLSVHQAYFTRLNSIRARFAAKRNRCLLLYRLGHFTEALAGLPDEIPTIPLTELRANPEVEHLNRGLGGSIESLRAWCQLRIGQPGAGERFKSLIAKLPAVKILDDILDEASLRDGLATTLELEGDFEAALSALRPVPKPRQEWQGWSELVLCRIHRRRGELLLAKGRLNTALDTFKEARQLLTRSPLMKLWSAKFEETRILTGIADAYRSLEEPKVAELLYEQVTDTLFLWMNDGRPQLLVVILRCCRDWLSCPDSTLPLQWLQSRADRILEIATRYPSQELAQEVRKQQGSFESEFLKDLWHKILLKADNGLPQGV